MLAGVDYCIYCGVGVGKYETNATPNNMLCSPCSAKYETDAGHIRMCPWMRRIRSRMTGDSHWDLKNRCAICVKLGRMKAWKC